MLVFKLFLDKKFAKNQGWDALAKNEFRYAKMPELASRLRLIKLAFLRSNSRHFLTLHYIHFLTLRHQGRLASHDNAAHDRRLPIITAAEAKSRNEMLME